MNDCEKTKDLERQLKEIEKKIAALKEQRCSLPEGVERGEKSTSLVTPNYDSCGWDKVTATQRIQGFIDLDMEGEGYRPICCARHKPPAARIFAVDMLRMCDEVEGVEAENIHRVTDCLTFDGDIVHFSCGPYHKSSIPDLLSKLRSRFPTEYLDVLEKEVVGK